MQVYTHVISGVLINRLFKWSEYKALGALLLIVFSFLVHAVFDKLAVLTYHPGRLMFDNPFWVAYQVVAWLSVIVLLYVWTSEYKWGIFLSGLPDLEWVLIYAQQLSGTQLSFYKEPYIHNAFNYAMDHTYPFCFLNNLVNIQSQPLAVVVEILIAVVILLAINTLNNRRRNIHF